MHVFTLIACQATFISHILCCNCRNGKIVKCDKQTDEGEADVKLDIIIQIFREEIVNNNQKRFFSISYKKSFCNRNTV